MDEGRHNQILEKNLTVKKPNQDFGSHRIKQIRKLQWKNTMIFRARKHLRNKWTKQLVWYRHVQRIAPSKLPYQVLHWMIDGKCRRDKPRKSWIDGITWKMILRDIASDDWEDKQRWKLEIGKRWRTLGTGAINFIKNYINPDTV